jgi:hypothetical protein
MSLNVASGYVLRVWPANDWRDSYPDALCGTVSSLCITVIVVEHFNKHGEINLTSEIVFYRVEINTMSIAGNLDTIAQSLFQVTHKLIGTCSTPVAK